MKVPKSKIFKHYIKGKRIYLKELTIANVSLKYCGWLNDPEINKYLETRKCTIGDLRKYVQERIDNHNALFVGIFDNESDAHIGNIKLEPINWDKKRAFFGIMIGDKNYWGRGIGTEATKLIIDYAFNTLGLEEIELGVISANKKAIKVYRKVGFKTVDIKKNAHNYDGVLYNGVIMVIKK